MSRIRLLAPGRILTTQFLGLATITAANNIRTHDREDSTTVIPTATQSEDIMSTKNHEDPTRPASDRDPCKAQRDSLWFSVRRAVFKGQRTHRTDWNRLPL